MATKPRTVGSIMSDDVLDDAIAANKWAKDKYPILSTAAQLVKPIGYASAALSGIDATRNKDAAEAAKAVLSASPVRGSYKIGNKVAREASDLIGYAPTLLQKAKNLYTRFGAGENAAEAYEAGVQHGNQYKKGGKVVAPKASRGDGCAQRGKTKGRLV